MSRRKAKHAMIAMALLIAANVAAEPTKQALDVRGLGLGMPRESAMVVASRALYPIRASKDETTDAWFSKGREWTFGCGPITLFYHPGECLTLSFTSRRSLLYRVNLRQTFESKPLVSEVRAALESRYGMPREVLHWPSRRGYVPALSGIGEIDKARTVLIWGGSGVPAVNDRRPGDDAVTNNMAGQYVVAELITDDRILDMAKGSFRDATESERNTVLGVVVTLEDATLRREKEREVKAQSDELRKKQDDETRRSLRY